MFFSLLKILMASHLGVQKKKSSSLWPIGSGLLVLLSLTSTPTCFPSSLLSCHTHLLTAFQTLQACVCSGPFTCCSLPLGHSFRYSHAFLSYFFQLFAKYLFIRTSLATLCKLQHSSPPFLLHFNSKYLIISNM